LGGIKLEHILEVVGNYFFPLVLSTYLILKIDKLISQMIQSQNDFHKTIVIEIKEIKKDILNIRLDLAKNYPCPLNPMLTKIPPE